MPRIRLISYFYPFLTYLALPWLALYLLWRSLKQPEYRQHWRERFGLKFPEVSLGSTWIHAVSLGETLAIEVLVVELRARYPNREILLTHTTPTGRAAGERLATRVAGVKVSYLAYDTAWAVARFLEQTKPGLGLLLETEIWPNLVKQCQQKKIPLALINARLSEKSFKRAQAYATLAKATLQRLSIVLAQSEQDAMRLKSLGAQRVSVTGNLKFDVEPSRELLQQGQAWRNSLHDQKVILLANTREGEEASFLAAMKPLQSRLRALNVLVLIVPRHPQRFDEVERAISEAKLSVWRRSLGWSGLLKPTHVLLGDSLGEMPSYYAMSDVCIMGGSFAALGGHNLIEACTCACPVILGPHTFNFSQASTQAIAAGAAWRVDHVAQALDLALILLEVGTDRLTVAREACLSFSAQHRGASHRTIQALEGLMGKPLISKTLEGPSMDL